MAVNGALPPIPIIALIISLILGIYKLIIQPIFFHPLRHIPSAHWSIPVFGDTWILYQRWRCRNNQVTYAAHLKHGTVVRLGRNELSVNCVDNGIRTIYAGGWEKHEWYPQQFAGYGVINMFSTLQHTPHSQKKRTMANIYSKSYIASSAQISENSKVLMFTRILPLLQSLSDSGTATDVHDMNNAFTMDFMSSYQFGLCSSTNFTQNPEERKLLHQYHCRRDYEVYSSELPWVKGWSRKIGLQIVPKFVDEANEILQEWCQKMCISADRYMSNSTTKEDIFPGDEPIVYQQFKTGLFKIRSKDESAGKPQPNDLILPTTRKVSDEEQNKTTPMSEIYSEMLDQLGAGHETSAIALTYLYWELSKRKNLQKALHEELMTLNPKIQWPLQNNNISDPSQFILPDPKQIDSLPLLQAILWETLRLHTPIPGMQPRVSPHIPQGSTLGKYNNIPGGVRVSAMPYTLHRNEEIFPQPEEFNPHRWLRRDDLAIKDEDERIKEMNRWFWAFGSGGRMCIGSHLAIQEIKLIVAAIYSNYKTEIINDDGIEEIDAYTTRPKSNQLILKFVHV